MGEWQQLLQSIFLGLIFSYLLAKLIAIVISFKEDNLSITREHTTPTDINLPRPKPQPHDDPPRSADLTSAAIEAESVVAEHGSVRNESSEAGSDDDWEGVESTELDELFSAATAFVASAATDRQKVSNDAQLQLYGLYKIATEGPCSMPQPSALKMTARAKWYLLHHCSFWQFNCIILCFICLDFNVCVIMMSDVFHGSVLFKSSLR